MGGVNSFSEMFTSAVCGQRGDTILRFLLFCYVFLFGWVFFNLAVPA